MDVNSRRKSKTAIGVPDLLDEGRKYGLSEKQLSRLVRYLNDKRLMRLISLKQFQQNAGAWLAALTGIVAEVLAMDTHVTIWMNKKLEKPRNWILSKVNAILPTKIDDIAIKALATAQQFTDDKLLPIKEDIFSTLSSRMHDKYEYHKNANALGLTLKEQKLLQKERLENSKVQAKEALKELRRRQFQDKVLLKGYYKDDEGYFHDVRKWKSGNPYIQNLEERRLNQINERIRERNEKKTKQQEILEQGKEMSKGDIP